MTHTIYDNTDMGEIVDFLRENDPDAPEGELWREAEDEAAATWDLEVEELDSFFQDHTVLFTGTIGCWDGTFPAGKIGEFSKLLPDAINGCAAVRITDQGGHLIVEGVHHDGRVRYEVKLLTDRGEKLWTDWEGNPWTDLTEQDMHNKIAGCNFFSRLPHFARTVYGCRE